MLNRINLYFNTLIYIKPSQVFYRLNNKIKRKFDKRYLITIKIPNNIKVEDSLKFIIPELDFNEQYLQRFNFEEILNNEFSFINIKKSVNLVNDWNKKDLQHLWRYNLHYFEYLYILAYKFNTDENKIESYNKFESFVQSWINNNSFPIGDGWHPYTVSLRLTVWISLYEVFIEEINKNGAFKKKLIESMYLQYQYLKRNLEKDVLGNHYFENIKAIIIASLFFKDEPVKNRFVCELLKQLGEQILDDGMHFELSPMYHKIVLEGLVKITYWLRQESVYGHLIKYIKKMVDVTYSFENGFGKTPSFNDSADGISKEYTTLLEVCKKYFNIEPEFKNKLSSSGFLIFHRTNKKLIFDTGDVCPKYLPAHGHCDALSFELSVNLVPVIVNSGTYQYENGDWRDYFRSTKAHNTVTVSGREQSQCWGSFRIAKRIGNVKRKVFFYHGIEFYAGAYISFSGDVHKRYIGFINENLIMVLDYVSSKITEDVKSYLHFNTGMHISNDNSFVRATTENIDFRILPIGADGVSIEPSWYSKQFNIKEPNTSLVVHKKCSSCFFGYLIDVGSKNYEWFESENGLRIADHNQININYYELKDLL